MEWPKVSTELAKILEKAITFLPCERKMMFGAAVYKVNGNMFTGVQGNNIFLRLSEADRGKIAARYKQAGPFEPVKGHVMKEYVTLPKDIYTDGKEFEEWLRVSFKYAQTVKPKPKKAK